MCEQERACSTPGLERVVRKRVKDFGEEVSRTGPNVTSQVGRFLLGN